MANPKTSAICISDTQGVLFDMGRTETPRTVNVASVPQRSPFRYPGGKTWLVPTVRLWMRRLPRRPEVFLDPFCGGGIISLTVVMENLAEQAVMIERDENVAAVWQAILEGRHRQLVRLILDFKMTRDRVIKVLDETPEDALGLAFQTLLRNRVQRGGILAPGASLVRNGEDGRGVASRWYPETLARRVEAIAAHRDRIKFIPGDAFDHLPGYLAEPGLVFFVDPPYTAGGKRAGRRLYLYNQIDHSRLFEVMSEARSPVMLTYDDTPEVRRLALRHGFHVDRVPMSNTHHNVLYELVITKEGSL